MEILHSKLQSPRLTNTLYRERLFRLFKEITGKKLITVTAGAGYGKTTLVVDTLSRLPVATVWYRLDRQDKDFMVFMAYLKTGIRRLFGGTGRQNGPEGAARDALKNRHDLLVELIGSFEKNGDRETVLVLDDYHLVQENPEINAALEFIIERLPRNLHVMIVSRKEPPIRISRIRVLNRLLEINETELMFTAAETNAYCRQVYKLPVTTAQADDMHAKTGGWAASLVLLGFTLKGKQPAEIEKHLALYKGSQAHIFAYLEENVFTTQSPELQEFMLKAALLEAIDTRLCNRVLQIDNADEMVRRMLNDHLLIFPVADNPAVFYYHHLLRDYLRAKLKRTYTRPQVDRLHRRIACEIEPDDVFQALHHFIAGRDFEAAVRIIKNHEIKLLLEGKIHFLQKCLDKIPVEIIEKNPQMLFAQAKLYSFYGKPQDAIIKLKAAHKLFKKQQAGEDMVKCLVDLGSQYYFTGHVREARLLMEQVLDEVDEQSSTYVIVMTYLVFLSAVLGELDKARTYARQARDVIAGYPEFERQVATTLIDTSYTYVHFISGEFDESRALNRKLRETALTLKIEGCLPLAYYQSAATSYFMGAYAKGYAHAQEGIRVCEKIELQDSQKGWVYVAWAQNCLGLDRLEEARQHLDRSFEIFEAPGNRWGLANARDWMHRVCLRQGNLPRAKKLLVQALEVIDGYGLPLTEAILENGLANILMLENRFSEALAHLGRSRTRLEGAAFYLFENCLLTAQCCLRLNRRKQAVAWLARGLDLSAERDFGRFIKARKSWMGDLAGDKRLTEHQGAYLQRLIGSRPDRRAVLDIRLLGRFRVQVGRRQIDASVLKSSKAWTILKYLAANRKAGFIPREVLIELLWPEADFRKTGKRFNVAMSALRKALEPDIPPRAASAYIHRKKDAYRLYDGAHVCIDVERFLDEMKIAERLKKENAGAAASHFRAAEDCYRGDFLEEDPYEEWCLPERDRLSAARLGLLESLLDIHEAAGDYRGCIVYADKLVQTDPYHEAAYRKIMSSYAALGNTARVKKAYEQYARNAADIDCPVSRETRALFRQLVST